MSATVYMMRGHTHAELTIMPGTAVSALVGDYIADRLTEYEGIFNKKTMRTDYTITGKYCSFNPANHMLHIPIAFATELANVLRHHRIDVVESRLADYPLRRIDVSVLPQFKDREWQIDLIKKCSDPTPGMKCLAAQTGKGKTYSTIRSICNLGYAACIVAPGLADQWIEKFIEYTGREDLVYKIQEFPSLKELMDSDRKPGVFICSIQTMQAYCKGKDNYKTLPYDFTNFFKHYGIGIFAVDEAHLNFHATTKMTLKINAPYNLFASATFDQTNRYAKRIFDVIYPMSIRYGLNEYDRYTTVYFYNYSGTVQENKCIRARGYSHMRYEAELLKKPSKFDFQVDKVICPPINMHFIPDYKPGHKCLIFCSTILMVQALTEALQRRYPALTVLEYVGSSDDDVLKEADIIVSTIGKSSTGLDVSGLTVVINSVSLQSCVLNPQMIGRLRKIDGKETIYVDMCDTNLKAHLRHADVRKAALKQMAKEYHEYRGPNDLVGIHFVNK